MRYHETLKNNEMLRVTPPVWLLALWGSYVIWQMGIVYFGTNALSLDGRTPLPFAPERVLLAMLAGYVVSIAATLFFQQLSLYIVRAVMPFSLLITLLFFFNLSESAFCAFYYIQVFLCVFLIGPIMAVTINLFTLHAEAVDAGLLLCISSVIIAWMQNEFYPVSFLVFNIVSAAVHVAVGAASFLLSPQPDIKYATPSDMPQQPKKLTLGLYLVIFLGCLMLCFCSSFSESVKHGVSIFYLSATASGAAFLVFTLRKKLNPVKLCTAFLVLAAAGMIIFALSADYPVLRLISCALLGMSVSVCNLSSFFGIYIFTHNASRFVAPAIVLIGMLTAALHSLLLHLLRGNPALLYLVCTVLAVLPIFAYVGIYQSLAYEWDSLNTAHRPEPQKRETPSALFPQLTGQENRLAELILQGYSGQEIASIMNITVGTMKNYRINMYQKLYIHSRRELFELVEQQRKSNGTV